MATRWLNTRQQHSWRALIVGMTLLLDRLDEDLQKAHGLSLTEYEILVRLSESPDRQMRMARLADALAHSRSRVTHTVKRLEDADLVRRCDSPDDGRGRLAILTDRGFEVLEQAAVTHVEGVRNYLVDLASAGDFAAVGRVMDAVTDTLVEAHPAMDLRT
ncbi:MAG: MarR family transcriptional regulator [Nocardioides sp.]|uniref:MarR family winged helix-turn-helix transcriptional regulator n=1 Tax=Nocardioides sp. TaxID=35761 RepID=UPI0039E348E7